MTPLRFYFLAFILAGSPSCSVKNNENKPKSGSAVTKENPLGDVNDFLDKWHQAASTADADTFFGSMADSSIYIGTDATERWTKNEFITFAKPYFDRGRAWDFKPYDRDVHFSDDGRYVWFSELLTTWMGRMPGLRYSG